MSRIWCGEHHIASLLRILAHVWSWFWLTSLSYIGRTPGFEISNWMHLSVRQVDCKNHLSECTIHLSEIYKANATYVKIRNTQSPVGQVLQVFHLSDCHFYSSQTIGGVKFRTLDPELVMLQLVTCRWPGTWLISPWTKWPPFHRWRF